MILARNLLQLLSGNKIYLILIMFFAVSCGGTKETMRKSPTRTAQTKASTAKRAGSNKPAKRVGTKVDTVQWTEKDPIDVANGNSNERNPIDELSPVNKKRMYNLSAFIPFDTRTMEGAMIADKSHPSSAYIHYYAGLQMGLAQLEQEGVNMHIKIKDSENGSFTDKLDMSLRSDDAVIMATTDLKQIKAAAKSAKSKEVSVISPLKATVSISDNPYYLQLVPNANDHYYKMVEHATQRYDSKQIIIVGRNGNETDQKRIKNYQKYNRTINGASAQSLHEYYVEEDSLLNGVFAFNNIFLQDKESVFLFPNRTSKDESYLRSCLRRLNVEKGFNKVIAYVMPMALNSDIISFDYYYNLNMRVVKSSYVDPTDYKVQQFKRDFYSKYNTLPMDEALEAYDMIRFVGRALDKHGTNFQFVTPGSEGDYLQGNYDIRQKIPVSYKGGKEYPPIQYFVNRHLDVLEFDGAKFTSSN